MAGCFTALHLPEKYQILMVSKGDIDECDSYLAQGGICVQHDPDDYDAFFEDTMHAGHYENRKESVDIMIRSSRDTINELIDYAVDFARDEEGNLLYTREAAHSRNRILYHEDVTGKEITTKLQAAVKNLPNVTIITHTTMVDILTHENTCDGVLLRTEDGELRPVYAKNTIWASGGIGGIYDNSTNYPILTGDALALSLMHGIRLEHVNYVQIHPTTLYSTKRQRRFLISESVRGEGAHLLDVDGNRFVDELLPRDVLAQRVYDQMKKDGTDFVWLDMSCIKDLDIETRFPNIVKHCREAGFEPTTDWIPVVPAQHYFMGGVWVDKDAHTSMEHLYAAGETACNGVHGRNRLASNSLLESLIWGQRAAEEIVRHEAEDDREIPCFKVDTSRYEDVEGYEESLRTLIWDEIKREEAIHPKRVDD